MSKRSNSHQPWDFFFAEKRCQLSRATDLVSSFWFITTSLYEAKQSHLGDEEPLGSTTCVSATALARCRSVADRARAREPVAVDVNARLSLAAPRRNLLSGMAGQTTVLLLTLVYRSILPCRSPLPLECSFCHPTLLQRGQSKSGGVGAVITRGELYRNSCTQPQRNPRSRGVGCSDSWENAIRCTALPSGRGKPLRRCVSTYGVVPRPVAWAEAGGDQAGAGVPGPHDTAPSRGAQLGAYDGAPSPTNRRSGGGLCALRSSARRPRGSCRRLASRGAGQLLVLCRNCWPKRTTHLAAS